LLEREWAIFKDGGTGRKRAMRDQRVDQIAEQQQRDRAPTRNSTDMVLLTVFCSLAHGEHDMRERTGATGTILSTMEPCRFSRSGNMMAPGVKTPFTFRSAAVKKR
jgi:hypothetical protein